MRWKLATWCIAASLTAVSAPTRATDSAEVRICFDYACAHEAQARFDAETLNGLRALLEQARSSADERALIAQAVGRLYAAAATQTPIWRDRGGNRQDNTDLAGAMDCLDHTANTTTFLKLMDQLRMLKYHVVREPVRRLRFWVAEHWSAQIADRHSNEEFVVDSWFYDPGTPAVIMPVAAWSKWESPEMYVKAGQP